MKMTVPAFNPAVVKKIVFDPDTPCNVPDGTFIEQVQINIRRGLPQLQTYHPHPSTAIIVCGGPSINDHKEDLREAVDAGGVIFTVNGAHEWCIENNFTPKGALMLDAREFNKRFLKTNVKGCRYLIASQCHPSVFDMLISQGRDVTLWHACSAGEPELKIIAEYYFGRMYPVTGGTTVAIRAISALNLLGFRKMDIFGLDSCWLKGDHHAYAQPENSDRRVTVWLRPKAKGSDSVHRDDKAMSFECAPWHVKQAEDFMKLIRERGDYFELCVRGEGLIASILKTGASIETEEATSD